MSQQRLLADLLDDLEKGERIARRGNRRFHPGERQSTLRKLGWTDPRWHRALRSSMPPSARSRARPRRGEAPRSGAIYVANASALGKADWLKTSRGAPTSTM